MTDELDKLFGAFDARKEKERLASEQKKLDHREFKLAASSLMRDVILPVLQELSDSLRARGHESSVVDTSETQSYPSASMTFGLAQPEGGRSSRPVSSLQFATGVTQDKVEVRRSIWGAQGKDDARYSGALPFKPIPDVTSEWVRTQALAFVNQVLSRN